MANPLFPTAPVPDTPYVTQDTFKTLSSPEFDAGKSYYRSLRSYPLFSANLTYGEHNVWSHPTTPGTDDIQGLYDFFMSCKGTAGAFDFRDFNGWDNYEVSGHTTPTGIRWPKLYVGVGTGATTTFEVPMYSSSSYHLWVNGSENTNLWTSGGFSSGQWKFHAGAGSNGRDTVEFHTDSKPTAGQIIEWQATGQRMVQAHFTTDNISFSAFTNMLTSTGLGIKEVK